MARRYVHSLEMQIGAAVKGLFHRGFGVRTLRTQDTSDLRQFGTISLVPKCLTFLCRCRLWDTSAIL